MPARSYRTACIASSRGQDALVVPSASLVHQQPQAMASWTSLLAGSVVALALVVAWLLLQGNAKNSKLKAIPAPPKTHWLLGHPGVIDQ